jgi:Ca2+-dependent lipid-binding protein
MPKNAQKCHKMPKNARKCPKMPENAQKCQKMPENAQKCQKMPKMPEPKCLKCQLSRPSLLPQSLNFEVGIASMAFGEYTLLPLGIQLFSCTDNIKKHCILYEALKISMRKVGKNQFRSFAPKLASKAAAFSDLWRLVNF